MSTLWIAALAAGIWLAAMVLIIGLCASAKRGDLARVIVDSSESDELVSVDAAAAWAAEIGAAPEADVLPVAASRRTRREPFARRYVCVGCGAHMRRPTHCQVCLGTEFAVAKEETSESREQLLDRAQRP